MINKYEKNEYDNSIVKKNKLLIIYLVFIRIKTNNIKI